MLVVISGPGGVGKGTVVRRLLELDPRLWLSRSWTTREQRPGESDDAYVFVDRPTFEAHIRHGGFLEHAEFLGHLYGSPIPEPHPGQDVVLEIDVQGAAQVRDRYPEALLIFLEAPSRAVQRDRLVGRGDDPAAVERRLDVSDQETAAAAALGAVMVVNDTVDQAARDVLAAIDGARAAADR